MSQVSGIGCGCLWYRCWMELRENMGDVPVVMSTMDKIQEKQLGTDSDEYEDQKRC